MSGEQASATPQSGEGRGAGRPRRLRDRPTRRRSVWTISLNLTPMIDVVFLLLFFFLVVSRFSTREGMLPARLPGLAAAVPTDIPRTPIRIRFLSGDGPESGSRVTIDRFRESPIPIASLSEALAAIRASQPGFDGDTPVHLLAGDDVGWDAVVNAYNAALAAEYQRIFFAGSP